MEPFLAERGGSSPLTRGALSVLYRLHQGDGLIPADAGSTSFRGGYVGVTWAHPR